MNGQKVLFGRYPHSENEASEPVRWTVLDQEGGKILLLSEECIDAVPYNERMLAITWEGCTLRKKLNEELIEIMFSKKEKAALVTMENSNPDSKLFHAKGGEPSNGGASTSDRMFILSPEEIEKYLDTPDKRTAAATGYARQKGIQTDAAGNAAYWLRAPGMRANCAVYVRADGTVENTGYHVNTGDFGVRVAVWVDTEIYGLEPFSETELNPGSNESIGRKTENSGEDSRRNGKTGIIFGIVSLAAAIVTFVLGLSSAISLTGAIIIVSCGLAAGIIGAVLTLRDVKRNKAELVVTILATILCLIVLGSICFNGLLPIWSIL